MKRTGVLVLVLLAVLTGCAGRQETGVSELPLLTKSPAATTTVQPPLESPGIPAPDGDPKRLSVSVEKAVHRVSRSATAAAVVMDRRQGATLVSENADRPFHAGSLVKLLIGIDVLLRRPAEPEVTKSVTIMIKYSDDKVASELWTSEGGTAIVDRMAGKLGLSATRPPLRPGQWGDTWISANDLVKVYTYLLDEAPAQVRETIVNGMAVAAEAGSDGFKQHFGIPDGIKQRWAIKQAWTNTNVDKSAHSTGYVGKGWPYIVILLTEHPRAVGWPVATRSVTSAAELVASLVTD